MNVGHLRQHRLGEQRFHRLAERFFFRLRMVYLRFNHLLLRHFRHFRQRDKQPLERGWRQGQILLLPVQAGGEVPHRNGGIINFDVHVLQRDAAQRNRVRRRKIQRPRVLFFYRRRRRHLTGVDRHVDIAQRNIVHAQAAIPQAL